MTDTLLTESSLQPQEVIVKQGSHRLLKRKLCCPHFREQETEALDLGHKIGK